MTAIIKAAAQGQKQILNVRSPQSNSSPATILLYSIVDNTQELATYSANYSAATGTYTVPATGHKDVRITAQSLVSYSNNQGIELSIFIDGVKRAAVRKGGGTQESSDFLNVSIELRALNAGQTVKIQCDGSGYGINIGGTSEFFQIFATS